MQKSTMVKIALLLGDIAITQVALFLTLWLRNRELLGQFGAFSHSFILVYGAWILILFTLNLYDIYYFKKPLDFFFNVIIFLVVAFFASVSYFYFKTQSGVSPKTILIFNILIFCAFFFIWRALANALLQRFSPWQTKTNAGQSYELMHKKISLDHVNEAWLLENIPASEYGLGQTIKRALDVAVGLVGLLVFFALFLPIALAIKFDSRGRVFYHQQRVGKDGKVFSITKFRTMYQTKGQDKELWRENTKNSITGVGRVLRRLHLDELPQAFSMLNGDISFVGPRPEFIELAKVFEREIPFYRHRYIVKPGIIGWAQINFPASQSVAEASEKFQYDLYYIKNRSSLLDLEIILKSIKLFFW